jgi:Ca2+-transporting ATPase
MTSDWENTMTHWHTLSDQDALKQLDVTREGLSGAEASRRLERYGPNKLTEKKGRTPLAMLMGQFSDFMIIVLIGAAMISGLIGEASDTIAIIVIVVLNAIIGFVQEYRAEKAMEALKKMAAPSATVYRDGAPATLDAGRLVPGDIVMLEAGKILPADMRILESAQLKIEEAAITGESVAVNKRSQALDDMDLSLGDRVNMAYKGTTVAYGRGLGVVTATGMRTELGKIAGMIQGEKEVKTPLQKRLVSFGQKLAIAVLAICAIVFAFGVIRGEPVLLMLLTAISLAVAAIPEALPAVVTISLALGARKLVRQSALIRRLPAVETLGSVTYICSDKTGTLTLNRMTVEELYVNGASVAMADTPAASPATVHDQARRELLTAMAISNDAARDAEGNFLGDPTETALFAAAGAAGFDKEALERELPRVSELPFDSERKRMTTLHKAPDGSIIAYTKGAVDEITRVCRAALVAGEERPVDVAAIEAENDRMARRGLRVLAFAIRRFDTVPEAPAPASVEKDLLFVGLAGMIDPPREEAADAVAQCKAAGIKPVMITGDHPATARAIAERLGIIDEGDETVSGRELAAMPEEEFERRVEHIRVYARVAPEQKLKILKGLQARGQFAAMTGDGVNDAPALKRADIGVAMGITGTDVSKQAAHMILLDDNFATIVKAVREGRRIFDNIRKFIRYTMTSNAGEIWTIFLAPFFGLPIPLLPIHILWINLVTDGLPGLALTAEPAEADVMSRPPRHPRESIFAHGLGVQIIWVGLLMGLVSIGAQAFAITRDLHWQTMVFTVLCFSQMGNVLAIRSDKRSLFALGLLSNKPLLGAFLLTIVLQLATIYVPFLNEIFRTSPLTAIELALTLAASSIVFFAVEIDKLIHRRRGAKKPAA